MLWIDNLFVALNSFSDNHIDVLVGEASDPKRWRFTGIYGHPKVTDRHLTWTLIKLLSQKTSLPWLLGVDFNEITSRLEKKGGPPSCHRQMDGFKHALAFSSLYDVPSVGPKFTNTSWKALFPASRAVNLLPNKSDHLPILMEVREFSPKRKKKKRRFRFEDFWLQDEDCLQVIETGWDSSTGRDPFSRICNKISNTREALLAWSKSRFNSLKEEITKTRAQLAFFFDNYFSAPPLDNRMCLESKLNSLLQQEQAFWKQRAKVFWLKDGDLNTKFFHRSATNRRRKNQLKGLFNEEGQWCTSDEDMEGVILNYYGHLFSSAHPTNIDATVNSLPCIITDEMNAALTKQLSHEEIHLALMQMHPSKSPGPDGFSPGFYQRF